MKKRILILIIFASLFCGCEWLEKKYDITIVNDFRIWSETERSTFVVYLDGNRQFSIDGESSMVIHDVPSGKHDIECGTELANKDVLVKSWGECDLQSDMEWSIKENYSIGTWYIKEHEPEWYKWM